MTFGEIPEEIRKAMEHNMDRAEMAGTSFRHDINRLVRTLPMDDLITFKFLMRNLHQNPEGAVFLEGVAAGVLELKYNICGGCGRDHEKEMLSPPVVVDDGTEQPYMFDTVTETMSENSGKDESDAEQYGVELVGDGRVVCKGCTMTFSSLKDRMLRPAGVRGCAGCQDKTKWG